MTEREAERAGGNETAGSPQAPAALVAAEPRTLALAPARPRLLTPSGSIRRKFPKTAAVVLAAAVTAAIVGKLLGGAAGGSLRGLGIVAGVLSACGMASWLEQRVYDKLLGVNRLARVVVSLAVPVVAMVVGPLLATLLGLIGLGIGDGSALLMSLMFGSFWLASAAVGSVVMVLIDVVVSAIISDFRSRVQAAVLSLVTLGTLGAVGLYTAARFIAEQLRRAANEGRVPEHLQLDLGDGPLDTAALREVLSHGETVDVATMLFVLVALLVTLPAVLSACGKLADAVMERLNPLRVAFDEVGAGRLDVRVEEAGSRELVAMGRGFNRMTESLHQTLADLEHRNVELSALNRAAIRFVPTQFLELLERSSIRDIRRGDQVELEISVLFSDIRDFTTIAEALGAKATFEFINRYVGHMEPAVHGEQGFINDFYGDGIMALFHRGPDAGLRAALGMHRALDELNAQLAAEGLAPIRIGVGLNSGSLMLGTIGGADRLACTVIGDPANAAARVEGMTKLYGSRLLVTHESVARLGDRSRYRLRELDWVQAKGKREPMGIIEVLDADPPDLAEAKWLGRDGFARGLEHYRAGRFADARAYFEPCALAAPADGAAKLYLGRCAHYLEQPPGPGWDGVARLESK